MIMPLKEYDTFLITYFFRRCAVSITFRVDLLPNLNLTSMLFKDRVVIILERRFR